MRLTLFAAAALALTLAGCRGMTSEDPPIHPNLNMDFQERFEEQEANPFFADDAAMRPVVPGTVARGGLRTTENAPFYYGRTADGAYVPAVPVAVTPALVERGRERYDIFCTVCHGLTGDGQGIIMVGNGGQGYGYTPAPSYHTERLIGVPDGYLYEVIANGVRNMPSYAHQIAPADRWAIVAYIRALQLSQNATASDVPEPVRQRLQSANPNVTLN
ncbi:MAG: cytochrome c [Rhodothermales bacterium]|nr:cytochrome c [Rhodothermales bacterium]